MDNSDDFWSGSGQLIEICDRQDRKATIEMRVYAHVQFEGRRYMLLTDPPDLDAIVEETELWKLRRGVDLSELVLMHGVDIVVVRSAVEIGLVRHFVMSTNARLTVVDQVGLSAS